MQKKQAKLAGEKAKLKPKTENKFTKEGELLEEPDPERRTIDQDVEALGVRKFSVFTDFGFHADLA